MRNTGFVWFLLFAVVAFSASENSMAGPADKYELDTGVFSTCATDNLGATCWGNVRVPMPALSNVTHLKTALWESFCALDDSGVSCWGGQANLSSVPTLQSPYDLDVGWRVACALDATGVVCWGDETSLLAPVPALQNPRQISISNSDSTGVISSVYACVLHDGGVTCWGTAGPSQLNVPPLSNPRMVSVGFAHACALDDSGVVCWGNNNAGQTNVPQLSNPVQVSAGLEYSCAIDDTGVVCWGVEGLPPCTIRSCGGPHYDYGQTRPPPLSGPFKVSAGYSQVCALDSTGAVCWGRNLWGEADDRHLVFDLQPDAEIVIPRGTPQECEGVDGTVVELAVNFDEEASDPAVMFDWYLDSEYVTSGQVVFVQVPLGNHNVAVQITTANGESYTATSNIEVVDTASPVLDVRFNDSKGNEITEVSRAGLNFVSFHLSASDTCDAQPSVSAFGGVDLVDGQIIRVQASVEDIIIQSDVLEVGVIAMDASGNKAEGEYILRVVD